MQLEISARHFTLGDEQREAIAESVDKLERFSPRPVESMKMTVTHEAGRFSADSVLYLKNTEFRAKGEGVEPEFAVVEIVENLRKQLIKFKGKISGRQKGEEGGLGKAMLADDVPTPTVAVTDGLVLRDMDVEAAKEAFQDDDQPFFLFRNAATAQVGVIYKREDGTVVHMESKVE